MQGNEIKTDELLAIIKKRIEEITSGEVGMPVYLKEAVFTEWKSRGSSHSMITVSCLFLNEESNICADLLRTGSAGFMECIYGNIISSIGIKGIEEINSALMEGRWYISESPRSGNEKEKKKASRKKSLNVPFKFSFLMKGA